MGTTITNDGGARWERSVL